MIKKYFEANENFENIISKFVKVENIETISTGWTNIVLKVFDGKDYFVFRFPRNEFWEKVIKNEYDFNKLAKNKLCVQTSNMILCKDNGRYFSYHKFINGYTLASKMDFLQQQDKQKIARQVANFLVEFEKLHVENDFNLIKTSTFLEELSKIEKCDYDLSRHQALISMEKTSPLVLSHGDFNHSNILIDDDNNLCAVLDFAFVSLSSPATDVARLCGRCKDTEFEKMLIAQFNKISDNKILESDVKNLMQVYDYVDNKYIEYMKKYYPEIEF